MTTTLDPTILERPLDRFPAPVAVPEPLPEPLPEPVRARRTVSRKTLWAWGKLLVGVGIVVAVMWKVGASGFAEGLRVISLVEVLAALAIGLATTVLCAWRWSLVARRLGLHLPLRRAVTDYYRALFLNAVLPAGVLGDVQRAVRHGREEGDLGAGVRAVVLERVAGQAVLIVAGVAVLLASPARQVGLIVLAVAAVVVLAYLAARRLTGARSRWRRGLDDIRAGLLARNAWPGVALLSALALAGHVTLFLIAMRAAGATQSPEQLLPIVVVALLAMGLPINVGGWGPREGVTALMFAAAGLGAAQGLTAAVTYGLLGLVASLPGALMLVRRRERVA
ncbi:lysylphosphatidylglycerol synthase transmembrane domain-containing protein [Actinophytocola xanthii]|uniref:Dolichol-P-glucose synthetase-like protein n=1 Tax=Actinophytocola xanthii TaxID=1912961 RepID=A0A1Q8CS14_9PSEU|nr:lysylphosphatidylglycerol synthase transmembrane domain-containing protein [Actinophytocola xanthii]OLF17159.1 dolichol-P-glucose synthetase-like protein [Actinophytocola xanthii]